MSETKFDQLVQAALDMRFEPLQNNIERSEKLLQLKVKIQVKYWDLEKECESLENELKISEEVQGGSNAEIRKANLELAKSREPKFDILDIYGKVLSVISYVERHNDLYISLNTGEL